MATEQGLLKSNHPQECDISQSDEASWQGSPHVGGQGDLGVIDRRMIPASATEGHWQATDGHSIRRIDWSVPDGQPVRGSILFLPGRGDHYEKYLESLEEWHRSGWRVTASDWRGQGASGRLGSDAYIGHISDYSIWIDDLACLWKQWKETVPGPHVLAAHSMGGHLALRAVAEKRVDPDALVLSAPMLGFTGQFLPLSLMHKLAAGIAKLGDDKRPAWKWSEKPGAVPAARASLLTHDEDRYADELWWREHRPELVMGPGSWRWVERGYASMLGLFAPGVLEAVATPVLIVATSNDKLVGYKAIEEAVRRLPNGELLSFGDEAHHEILREVDAVRDRAMTGIAEFLDRAAPRK